MNIIQQEFIGTEMTVDGRIHGTVVDETKHTFLLDTAYGRRRVVKQQHTFTVNNQEVSGHALVARPEERIKVKTW